MRALDCCAGAGGLSLGLQRAGFDVHGVELDVVACETHRALVGPCDNVSLWDYGSLERFELVAGGIPCQSHSTAGKRGGTCDPRGQLYVPFLRIAQQAQARAVLIENVRGMLTSPSATHGTALHEVERLRLLVGARRDLRDARLWVVRASPEPSSCSRVERGTFCQSLWL